ncbi:Ham1 family, putative [Plasmodium malariae]|uniref:Ham1 family, putative n=1 Tax=Plasmodium malariae TaxID=5858 RepID=A0A1C3KA85_PLAMA|nr:Ham1 family, putative [Plasmodium malariae]
MNIYLVTGNKNKRLEFERLMKDELKVEFVDVDLTEIQSNDIVNINENKAQKAYEILEKQNIGKGKKFLVITDDTGLYLNCLNEFPGPYMYSFLHYTEKEKGERDTSSGCFYHCM